MKTKFLYFSILALVAVLFAAVGCEILSLPDWLAGVPGVALALNPAFASTPARKMMQAAGARGYNLNSSQGTSRTIFDTLPFVPGQEIYKFFDQVGSRPFPLSNVPDNKEDDQEQITVQRISFQFLGLTEGDIDSVEGVPEDDAFFGGVFQFILNNNRVVKPYALRKLNPKWNPYSQFNGGISVVSGDPDVAYYLVGQQVIVMDSLITIPPQTRYSLEVQLPPGYTAPEGITHFSCLLDGAGAIEAARAQY